MTDCHPDEAFTRQSTSNIMIILVVALLFFFFNCCCFVIMFFGQFSMYKEQQSIKSLITAEATHTNEQVDITEDSILEALKDVND